MRLIVLLPKAGWEIYTLWYTLFPRLDGRHIHHCTHPGRYGREAYTLLYTP